jgi:hypothetical protein
MWYARVCDCLVFAVGESTFVELRQGVSKPVRYSDPTLAARTNTRRGWGTRTSHPHLHPHFTPLEEMLSPRRRCSEGSRDFCATLGAGLQLFLENFIEEPAQAGATYMVHLDVARRSLGQLIGQIQRSHYRHA